VGAPTIVRVDVPVAPEGATARPSRPGIPFLPGLEGLRGAALLGVLLFHAGFGWAKGGFLGVSTFFTLSGFLITLLLVWEFSAKGRIDLKNFWMRRYRRLMPASLACLAGVCLFGATVATPGQLATLRGDVIAALAYVANWRFILTGQSYAQLFRAPSPVLHFWSLAIEEQFYLVFPVLVAGTLIVARGSRRVLSIVLGLVAGLSLLSMFLLYSPGDDPSRVYYGTTTRAFELLVGALLALLLSHPAGLVLRIPRWAWVIAGAIGAGVTLALWSTASQAAPWLYQGGLAGYALMSALVIVAAIRRGPIRAVLAFAPMRWLGAVSYGAYLYHWPIYLWLTPARTHLSIWPLFGLRLAVTLAVAAVSARLLEKPIRLRLRPAHVRPAMVSAIAIVAVLAGVVVVTKDPPKEAISFVAPPMPSFTDVPAGGTTDTTAASATPITTPAPTEPGLMPAPIPLLEGEQPRILLLGDSAALTLGDGLSKWTTANGRARIWDAGKLGCSIGRGGLIRYLNSPRPVYDYCDWAVHDPPQIAEVKPHVIAVLFGTWDVVDRQIPGDPTWRSMGDPVYDDFLRKELSTYMDLLTAQGSTVVWMTHPHIEAGVLDAVPGPFAENDPERMDELNDMIRDVAKTKPRVVILDLRAHMQSTPEGELDLTDRPDGIHWTPEGSYRLAPWLGESLDAIAHGVAPPAVDSGG
jgi:peptidoglycan/LPS O-acetylase OafA/YrhL